MATENIWLVYYASGIDGDVLFFGAYANRTIARRQKKIVSFGDSDHKDSYHVKKMPVQTFIKKQRVRF